MGSPVVVPEGHRQHAWHDGLHAGEPACAVLGCCLVHDNYVEPMTPQPSHHFRHVIGQIGIAEGIGNAVAASDVREATRLRRTSRSLSSRSWYSHSTSYGSKFQPATAAHRRPR